MRTWMLFLSLISLPLISIQAQEDERVLPTQEQIQAYMAAYDSQYDSEHSSFYSHHHDRLLLGRDSLSQSNICMNYDNAKKSEVDKLNTQGPQYHEQLGRLDGLWDARKVGCQGAFESIANLKQRYDDEIRPRLANDVNLGDKIVVIKLELLAMEPADLQRSCLNHARLEGIIQVFLSEDLRPGDRLDYTQSHCTAIARQINNILDDVAVAHRNNQDIAEESGVPVRIFSPSVRKPAETTAR